MEHCLARDEAAPPFTLASYKWPMNVREGETAEGLLFVWPALGLALRGTPALAMVGCGESYIVYALCVGWGVSECVCVLACVLVRANVFHHF